MSGTGPKAGGPNYVKRFTKGDVTPEALCDGPKLPFDAVQAALHRLAVDRREPIESLDLPGPTGESNRLSLYPKGVILCLGPTPAAAREQARIACDRQCGALIVTPGASGPDSLDGYLDPTDLKDLKNFDAVALWSGEGHLIEVREALASREGPIIPLIAERDFSDYCVLERHVCVDTTASGGNATLLAVS